MTHDETVRLAGSLSDLAAVIHQADLDDKVEIHHRLGLQLTYTPGHQTIRAEIAPTCTCPATTSSQHGVSVALQTPYAGVCQFNGPVSLPVVTEGVAIRGGCGGEAG
ncbi:hypothetical protein GCM10010211_45860 [Streptomyces albospinus]|uniref:Uncharacterized protein n=1 Tax=Streptomyces albospinus TaxID=285515 RepID=A0ABQ2V9B9_9ACTN|nr:hypothetical protein [Streptomyces albospinus]GGU74773.1 hypothetical protein GCM10010211_45860 [Streptomyces albospinus]